MNGRICKEFLSQRHGDTKEENPGFSAPHPLSFSKETLIKSHDDMRFNQRFPNISRSTLKG